MAGGARSLLSSHVSVEPSTLLLGRPSAILGAIDSVHTDGDVGPIRVVGFSGPPGRCGYYDPVNREIGLNLVRDDHEQTVVHEVGHIIALEGFGSGFPVCASAQEFQRWRDAVVKSSIHQQQLELKRTRAVRVETSVGWLDYRLDEEDVDELEYLLLWEEIWARTYVQFIAKRSGNVLLLQQIAREDDSDYGRIFKPNWPHDDFFQIESAVEGVLQRKGWM